MSLHNRNPIFLSPATPEQLLSYIIEHYRYPTTLLIGCPKQEFVDALVNNVRAEAADSEAVDELDTPTHLKPTIDASRNQYANKIIAKSSLQTAISRHIRVLFIPSVSHLRAYLSTFTTSSNLVKPPPPNQLESQQRVPLLLFYGFLQLHLDGSEWSAQGLSISAACLVEAAMRTSLRAVIIEPPSGASDVTETITNIYDERMPLLSGSIRRSDGTWIGQTVSARQVLYRWFTSNEEEMVKE